MSIPHTGNRYTDHTPETDVYTTHREQIYRPYKGTDIHYKDHTLEQDIQTTHGEQICRPQSVN